MTDKQIRSRNLNWSKLRLAGARAAVNGAIKCLEKHEVPYKQAKSAYLALVKAEQAIYEAQIEFKQIR